MSNDAPAIPAMKGPQLSPARLRELETIDDVQSILREAGIDRLDAADKVIGDGFALLEDKGRLVGVPLIFLTWTFSIGDYADFVSARVVTIDDGNRVTGRFIINDGGTGIHQQLEEYTNETGAMGGLIVRKGLRRSDYEYTDEDGKLKPATTFYIDTSVPV